MSSGARSTTPARAIPGPDEALAAAARLLAAQGSEALPAVLALVRNVLACRDVVLRGPDPVGVLARVGPAPVPAQVRRDVAVLDIPVRFAGQLRGVLTATADRPLTPSEAAVLTGFADLAALVLSGDLENLRAAAGRAVLDDEADRAQAAATLFEGVEQALVTARYTVDRVAEGAVGAKAVDEPLRTALSAVRQAYDDLRAHALEDGLRAALHHLAVRMGGDRLDDGSRELRLVVLADDPALDRLPPPVAVVIERVAEAALRGATGAATLQAASLHEGVKLWVESAEVAYDASELSRWARRANALGGDLRLRPGGVELSLPVELSVTRPHESEGRNDHRSDL